MATEVATKRRTKDELLRAIASPVIDPFDYAALTYKVGGNGDGKAEIVTLKQGGSGGTTIATITLVYDGSNRVSTVTKV